MMFNRFIILLSYSSSFSTFHLQFNSSPNVNAPPIRDSNLRQASFFFLFASTEDYVVFIVDIKVRCCVPPVENSQSPLFFSIELPT